MTLTAETIDSEALIEDEVSQIAERFFADIDDEAAVLDGPVFLAHFVTDDERHRAQEHDLLAGVKLLCTFPESNCDLSNEDDSVILTSRISGNQLRVSQHCAGDAQEAYATTYWIAGTEQPLPY